MDFFINRNSTLPKIKMKLILDGEVDYRKFNDMLETATATFSMVSIDDKTFKIANKSAEIIIIDREVTNDKKLTEYYIAYNWTEKDVNKVGNYIGEFKIDFFDPNCGTLIIPIKDKLYIYIQDSITKTERVKI